MNRSLVSVAALCRHFALAGVFGALVSQAQGQAASNPTPAELAKYDANKNGVLDPTEVATKNADAAKAAEVLVLNPFEVSTDKDVGYQAGNTLTGGRVDTPIAITPGAISVMTKEFMDDFNITDMNQAGQWTIGFDLGTAVPNSDPTSASTYQNIVRGANSQDNFPTRNGAINFGVADSYNTDRIEFNRGPDTSMFGDGGPGGRQGSTSKSARFNGSQTSTTLQMDDWGGYRSTLDYSKGFSRIGIRFNALYQNAPGFQEDTDKIKKAWTINVKGKLAKNTELTAEYERTSEWNSLWSITNGDTQNLWDGVTLNLDNTSLLSYNQTQRDNAGIERTVAQNGNAANYFVYNFATNSMLDYAATAFRTKGIQYSGNAMRIPYVGNQYLLAIPARRSSIPGIDKKFKAAPHDNIADRDANTVRVELRQTIGNLNMQVGASRNSFDNNTIWSNLSANAYILDINRLLPDGSLNPRFLQPFTDVEQNNLYSQDATREVNFRGSYRFFVPKVLDYKQMFSLNLSNRDSDSENRTSSWRRVDNLTTTTTNGVTTSSFDPFNNANRFFYRVYWNDPRPSLRNILTNPNGKVPGEWRYIDTAGGLTERNVKTGSVTGQSGFLNEKMVLTYSFSRTQNKVTNFNRSDSLSRANAPTFKNVLGLPGQPLAPSLVRKGGSTSVAYGFVSYPLKDIKQDGLIRKWVAPIGLSLNIAQNTQAPGTSSQNPLINGEEPPLTHSETVDFSFRYSVPNGKAYMDVRHYQTTQYDIASGFGSAGNIVNIWTAMGSTDPKLTQTTTGNFAYSDPSSRRLEGWEAEITANPTRNITMLINYSHPLAYVLSESEDRKAYLASNRAKWEAALLPGAVGVNGTPITPENQKVISDSIAAIDQSLAGLTTGTLDNGTINHRINVSAAYSFTEGKLRGLRVNAGVNYRGHQKSGSRDARLKYNIPDSAPNPSIAQSTEAAFDYMWVPPNWKHTIQVGGNYTRRFGKYQYRFQLNVTNLLNNLDPIWGRSGPSGGNANSNGAYLTVATNALFANNPRQQILASFVNPDPRKITFTTTVSF